MIDLDLPAPVRSCVVYTPPKIAAAIVTALAPSQPDHGLSWLEPSAGKGVFLEALAQHGVRAEQIVALDLARCPEPTDRLARMVRPMDFLRWARQTNQRFDRIVANPPYVAIRELPFVLREEALRVVSPEREPIGHRANYWYAFLCASLSLLRPGGSIGFVLPAAWSYADYAAPLRASIARWFRDVRVFRSERPLFPDIQDGSVVLIAKRYQQGPGTYQTRMYRSQSRLIAAVRSSSESVALRPPVSLAQNRRVELPAVELRQVMIVRIGAVTGDARFFLMSEQQRLDRRLPKKACRPVLSRSHHLISAEMGSAEWERLRIEGQRVWLFDPPASLLGHPAVQEYMQRPVEEGGCRRDAFKLRCRGERWYRAPLPVRPDGFVSGMSHQGPWLALRCMPSLTASNTLYTIRFRKRLQLEQKTAWALAFLTSHARMHVNALVRRYPDGLMKIEPGDLQLLRLPQPPRRDGSREVYRQAIAHMLAGKVDEATRIADAWFQA